MSENGWLIEMYPGFKLASGKPGYLRLYSYKEELPKPEWTTEPELALRFGRESDAAWVAMLYPQMCCLARITEHVFLGGVSSARKEEV